MLNSRLSLFSHPSRCIIVRTVRMLPDSFRIFVAITNNVTWERRCYLHHHRQQQWQWSPQNRRFIHHQVYVWPAWCSPILHSMFLHGNNWQWKVFQVIMLSDKTLADRWQLFTFVVKIILDVAFYLFLFFVCLFFIFMTCFLGQLCFFVLSLVLLCVHMYLIFI